MFPINILRESSSKSKSNSFACENDYMCVDIFIIPPANKVSVVYSDPYVRPSVRPSLSNPLLL